MHGLSFLLDCLFADYELDHGDALADQIAARLHLVHTVVRLLLSLLATTLRFCDLI